MKITLSTGTAHMRVQFSPARAGEGRLTTVALELPSGDTLTGVSACSPQDNFSRFIGKKLALERLLYSTENGYHGVWTRTGHPDPHMRRAVPLPLAERRDRAAIWAAVLGPKYTPRRERVERLTAEAAEAVAIAGWF